jgi:hypothetical protein
MNQEPAQPRAPHFGWRIFSAVAIIAIGVLFLLDNLGYKAHVPRSRQCLGRAHPAGGLRAAGPRLGSVPGAGRFDAEVAHGILCTAAVAPVDVLSCSISTGGPGGRCS